MSFIGNDKIEIRRREQVLVFVVDKQGLYGADNNLSTSPLIPVFLVDDVLVVIRQISFERLVSLIFKLKTINKEQHTSSIARFQEQFNDGSGSQGLSCTRSHFKQEPVLTILYC